MNTDALLPCPRCGNTTRTKCGKPNNYCVKCDDQTSYDYCKPRAQPASDDALVEEVAVALLSSHFVANGMEAQTELGAFDQQYRRDARVAIPIAQAPILAQLAKAQATIARLIADGPPASDDALDDPCPFCHEPEHFGWCAPRTEAVTAPLLTQLAELLCIIHRDGGHRINEVGMAQAYEEAMQLSSERIAGVIEGRRQMRETCAQVAWARSALATAEAIRAIPLEKSS